MLLFICKEIEINFLCITFTHVPLLSYTFDHVLLYQTVVYCKLGQDAICVQLIFKKILLLAMFRNEQYLAQVCCTNQYRLNVLHKSKTISYLHIIIGHVIAKRITLLLWSYFVALECAVFPVLKSSFCDYTSQRCSCACFLYKIELAQICDAPICKIFRWTSIKIVS